MAKSKDQRQERVERRKMEKGKSHFVLVHGACHGAWCWYKVVTLLKSAGHKVTALDLAASGVHPKQVHELHSISDYSEPLMDFMASLPPKERVILVGHSLGGVTISVAMERFPEKVSVAVFAPASMPGPDLSYISLHQEFHKRLASFMDTQFTFDNGPDKPPNSLLFGPNFMSTMLYQLSPPEDLTLAILLARPFGSQNDAAAIEETALTREKYGSVRRVYIVCDKDKVTDEDFQRWMIENNPPDEVMLIPDSDHMVMFSKPQELCSCLEEIADKYD
ncbi:methylesterase 3-like [Durio zibethinus]|uniref:Methylesterase 3-like n=1 Tax=Durio zibethinus TaxID=66656 RepID=A0A6P6BDS0_DURZI|nr:methylesterase 3-like [Durio zibethinus]